MGKGTRAAGNRRRAPAPAQSPYAAPQGGGQPPSAPPAPVAAGGRARSGRGATFSVLMMTLAALAGVGLLAAQAEATAPKVRAVGTNASAAKESTGSKPGTSTTSSTALPANSGQGTRIVYSPSAHRVWLVEGSTVERTMKVVPGTVTPPPRTFTVYSKTPGSLSSDGLTVLYVVKFDSGTSDQGDYGFDAESGVTGLPPAPKGKTGGVRMTQADAQLLYEFASVGTTVVVV